MNAKLGIVILLLASVLVVSLLVGNNAYADPTFSMAAAGDLGCNTNTKNTINIIKQKAPNLDLWLGDLSYVDSNIDCFISQVSSLAARDEAVIGNHEDTEDGSSQAREQTKSYFGIPSQGYYAKTYEVLGTSPGPDMLLIGLYTQQGFGPGTAQYNFVKSTLENSNAPLKIVASHKPFVSCTCKHGNNGQFSNYQPIFEKTGVDLVLAGHNHNAQFYETKNGVKYIVSGEPGDSHYSLTSIPSGFSTHYKDASKWGFTYIEANFQTMVLSGKFVTNSGADVSNSLFTQKFNASGPGPGPGPQPQPGKEVSIPIDGVTATTYQAGSTNTPEKTLDNNYNTRWTAKGDPQSITYALNQTWTVSKVGVAFYVGDTRTADIEINGQKFTSAGNTLALQNFTLTTPITTNTLKIVGHGNSLSDWNSLVEVQVYGKK